MQSRVLVRAISTVVLEMRDSVRGIDARFTYFQDPVRVEDALDCVFPFPSACSVEALVAEIVMRFQQGPSKEQVTMGDFEIFSAKNPTQLLTTSGRNVLLPRMFVNMAILIEADCVAGDEECSMPYCASKTFVEVISGGKTW